MMRQPQNKYMYRLTENYLLSKDFHTSIKRRQHYMNLVMQCNDSNT